jgi:ribonuclease D
VDAEPKGRLVTDAGELRAAVAGVRGASRIAFDTEFVGERTYFPRLCLIQIGTEREAFAVDPLAVGALSPLDELLFDAKILKLVHAGWQDLKIFYQRTGRVPAPVYDTQIAASVLGMPAQAAYASVVREFLGVDVKKGHSYSDWGARPLSASQLAYALDDVRFLPALHDRMSERLEKRGASPGSGPGSPRCRPRRHTRRTPTRSTGGSRGGPRSTGGAWRCSGR